MAIHPIHPIYKAAASHKTSTYHEHLKALSKAPVASRTKTMHAIERRLSTKTLGFPGRQFYSIWPNRGTIRTKKHPRHKMLDPILPEVSMRSLKSAFSRRAQKKQTSSFTPRAVADDSTVPALVSLVAIGCILLYPTIIKDASDWLKTKVSNVDDAVGLYLGLKRMRQADLLIQLGAYCKRFFAVLLPPRIYRSLKDFKDSLP